MMTNTKHMYLNHADNWPDFAFHNIDSDGSLTLKKSDDRFERAGAFRGGPFHVPEGEMRWHRVQVFAEPLPPGVHLQLFTFAARTDKVACELTADNPFNDPAWYRAPFDLLDVLVPHPPATNFWIGGVLLGAGHASPVLHQIRVDYEHDSYLPQLPAVYREEAQARDFLRALLSLPESVLGALEQTIDDLPRLFDPAASPASGYPSWLDWLAGWLAFDMNEAWTDSEAREFLAQALQTYGQRGTVEGLRRYLKMYAGVNALIDEPGLHTALWALGEPKASTLGFTTRLAPGPLQGAVLDASATIDQSHLVKEEDFGAALFDDLGHHFCVGVYCSELRRPGALDDVKAVIEREKPAHTTYELCLIEPRMRVSIQSRVGIDAIVAAGPLPAYLGSRLDIGVLTEAEDCTTEPRLRRRGYSPAKQ